MGLGFVLANDLNLEGFGTGRYVRNYKFKERPHASKSKVDEYGNARYLEAYGSVNGRYAGPMDVRYAAATQLTYDSLISLYDVNAGSFCVHRFYAFDDRVAGALELWLKSLAKSRPNIEARLIGGQDGMGLVDVRNILRLLNGHRITLVEVDLFGREARHIAIDTKLGMSYNILLMDRIYRPGELANTMTVEQFERTLPKRAAPLSTPSYAQRQKAVSRSP